MKKCFGALLAALLMAGCLSACQSKPAEAQVFAMDTVMLFSVYGESGEAAIQDARQEISRLENLLSRTREDSEVALLNRTSGEGQAAEVGSELCDLIEQAREFSQATADAFDITLAPISSAWGFTEDAYQVPAQAELDELLTHVGMEHVYTDTAAGTAWLDKGTQIDLGAIAKGYASDRIKEIFFQHGITSGTISLGGNVWTCGTKPDGSPWRVGIQDPKRAEESSAYVGTLELSDAFAVTSGGYQRYFEENGEIYHHILNPATGYPAQSGLISVTIVSEENGTMCDALSTALFVMGEERAVEFWHSGQYDFDMILVTEDNRVLVTAGIADAFALTEGSEYVCQTIS